MPVELRNVSFTYAPGTPYEAQAVDDLSLTVCDGEFVGVMGKTGCGKSTLIQLIAGLIRPSRGQILLDGEDINGRHFDRDRLRREVGVVFQFPEIQLFETTVRRDVSFGLRHFKWSEEEKEASVRQALAWMDFDYDAVKDLSPLGFSGGEKRRLAIAGILAARPRILILDEPVAGLDPLGREAFLRLLGELNRNGTTILVISHNADALAEYADRIVILKDGRLLRDGPTAEVFADYDALRANGAGVCQVREAAEALRRRGWEIPAGTVRYGQLLEYVSARKRQPAAGRNCADAREDAPAAGRNCADAREDAPADSRNCADARKDAPAGRCLL